MGRGTSSSASKQVSSTSPWEMGVAILGFASLVAIIGYMAYFALSARSEVPQITVEKVQFHRSGTSYVVQFEARNDSAATAASLKIEGELSRNGTVVETTDTQIDYLPPYSKREAGLFFQKDPALYDLKLIPKGYDAP